MAPIRPEFRPALLVALLIAAATGIQGTTAQSRVYFPDDPIATDPETQEFLERMCR